MSLYSTSTGSRLGNDILFSFRLIRHSTRCWKQFVHWKIFPIATIPLFCSASSYSPEWTQNQMQSGPLRGGEGEGILPWGPQIFKGPHKDFISILAASSCCFFIFSFPLHCLDSMSEHLGRIISNAFAVSVDKY